MERQRAESDGVPACRTNTYTIIQMCLYIMNMSKHDLIKLDDDFMWQAAWSRYAATYLSSSNISMGSPPVLPTSTGPADLARRKRGRRESWSR